MQNETSLDSKSDLATANHTKPKPKQAMTLLTRLISLSHDRLGSSMCAPKSKAMVNLQ